MRPPSKPSKSVAYRGRQTESTARRRAATRVKWATVPARCGDCGESATGHYPITHIPGCERG